MHYLKTLGCTITTGTAGVAILAGAILLCAEAFAVPQAATTLTSQAQDPNHSSVAPQTITLQDALQRAKSNSPEFQAALTEFGLAREDRVQSRAALLPSFTYNGGFIYTQGNGTSAGRFVANNGVHE